MGASRDPRLDLARRAEVRRLPVGREQPPAGRGSRPSAEKRDRKKLEAREVVQSLGNGVEAHFSVPSACYIAITYSPDFCDAIRAAISLGGDTDTIAGMVGAIVGAQVGERGLPFEWIEQLEDGPRGRSFARGLADRLFQTWLKIHQTSPG